LTLPSAGEGFVLGERGIAVAETWDMGDAGGALGAGEDGWGIRMDGSSERLGSGVRGGYPR
jgi:hypothetical protein